ncbi:UNVERIFIED_CONTAM: homeobox domain-containing protein [Streptococcus canis]
MFTKKQLEGLKTLFSKNPCSNSSLWKEWPRKLAIYPIVPQIWLQNLRAKLKKTKM